MDTVILLFFKKEQKEINEQKEIKEIKEIYAQA